MKTNSAMLEQSELLILHDGKILAHNITPEIAAVLCELNPENELMKQRAIRPDSREPKSRVASASSGCEVIVELSIKKSLTQPLEAGATHFSHET